jgi:hypothetical protein
VIKIAQSPGTLKICSMGATKKPKGHLLASCVLRITQPLGTLDICSLSVTKTTKGHL